MAPDETDIELLARCAAIFDPPAMNATEWELRKALNHVTNNVPEDDVAAQAEGWRIIANAAGRRANQLLRAALKEAEATQ